MSDLGRVHKQFHLHPKAQKARSIDPGSISLWLFANCFCRNGRREGNITRDEALSLGTESEINALLVSGLWREVPGGYVFNDWAQWNPDMLKKSPKHSASFIVQTLLPNHPRITQDRLADEVLKLIDEGVPLHAIQAGVTKWGERKDARFAWLGYFVSDAIREGECGIHAAIKQARRTWNMSGLVEFGYKWVAPDLPDGMRTARQVREYMQEKKSEWLDRIEASLGDERTA